MHPQEERQIAEWSGKLSGDIQIHVILTKDETSQAFSQFCENLSRIAPKVHITKQREDSENAPRIRIGHALHYEAIPEGTELEPFLDALTMLDEKYAGPPAHIQESLGKIDMPADLRVYVSPQCPFCPATVRQLLPLAGNSSLIRLFITDAFLFPEMAKSDHIQSVPTVLLDADFRWTGAVRVQEILEMLTTRDPANLSAASLERMILEGNAFQLSEMMLEKAILFPAFSELLAHPHFSVRLGAMAAMEDIADQNPGLAANIVEPLWERFHGQEDQVKGDILHILGEAGNDQILPRLEMISKEASNTDIKEAATDAIDKIRKKDS